MCAIGVIKYTENGNYIYIHFVNFSHSALAVFYAGSHAVASGFPSQKNQ